MSNAIPLDKTIRVGIIGCGVLGRIHAERLSALPNVQIVGVSDPDTAAMQSLLTVLPSTDTPIAAHADYRDLLANAPMDAVSINSPNRWHVEQLLASLAAGCHVLCEKPLSLDPSEVEQVVAATDASGLVVAVAYQSRYRRDSRVLRAALQSGRWGRITDANIYACEDWITPNVGTWRHDPKRCPGGYFADANGHQLDLLFWTAQLEPVWISAMMNSHGTPVPQEARGKANLAPQQAGATKYEDIPLLFDFEGFQAEWHEEIRIETEHAEFIIRDTRLLWSDGSAPLAPFPDELANPDALNQPDDPDTAFIAALRGGPPIVSPPETVWPVLRFTRAALASAEASGKPITV